MWILSDENNSQGVVINKIFIKEIKNARNKF